MRSGVVALLIGVVFAFAPSASAKGNLFPDLPGLGGAERLTHTTAPKASDTTATVDHLTNTDRVPALHPSSVTKDPVADGKAFIKSLPGTGQLPAFGAGARPASSGRESADPLVALALVVVVLFTRFLVRLNTFGRHA